MTTPQTRTRPRFIRPETSPFTPGVPAAPDLFTGRADQVRVLLRKARAAAGGRLEVAFLSGSRGIGKSSLSRFAAAVSERASGMLPIHVFLGGATSPDEVVRRSLDRLANVARPKPWWEQLRSLFGERLTQVGLFGASVQFAPKPEELVGLTSGFGMVLAEVVEALPERRSGLFLILDDLNGLGESTEFATWLKSFVDTVAVDQTRLPLFVLLVGGDEVRRQLIRRHESVARFLDPVHIAPWSPEKSTRFFRRAFASAAMTIEADSVDLFTLFAGGMPVLAHELGDVAFRLGAGRTVTRREAEQALPAAAEILGRKYLEAQVLDRLRSAKYRALLGRFPEMVRAGIMRRREIRPRLPGGERRVFDNFLREMVRRGILERVPDLGPGCYRFVQDLHFLYFCVRAVEIAGAGRHRTRRPRPSTRRSST